MDNINLVDRISKKHLNVKQHQVYIVLVRRMIEYAAAAWPPWLSATSTIRLEKVQLEAARAITGLVHTIPVEAVLAESQLPPISMRIKTISILRADELAHLPSADDHRQTLCMRTAPEEERLEQNSISLSESTWSQSPGLNSNSPLQ